MNLWVKLLELYTPGLVKRQALKELFAATAQAFGREMPRIEKLPFEQQLRIYALFTAQQAQQALEGGNTDELQARLGQSAYSLGQNLRERLGIGRWNDAMALAQVLYRIISIDFTANSQGEITIKRCYFSRFYSAQVCQLISALDEGLLAGLSGGGTLRFTARISEGAEACKACFLQRGSRQEVRV